MVFSAPSWVPPLSHAPPDNVTLAQFMHDEAYGRHPIRKSRNPFTCGLTGKSYTLEDVHARTEALARALAARLEWSPQRGSSWDKVVCIFSLNSIDYMTVAYATHRLSGIVTPANAVYSAEELAHQLRSSNAKAMFTCAPLLDVAIQAAKLVGMPRDRIYLLEIPGFMTPISSGRLTLSHLIEEGGTRPELPRLHFAPGQGARQTAFLCYSSGTSGLPKAVMISHYNIIANVIQHTTYESVGRRLKAIETQNLLAPLPMSHIYALVVAAHSATWRGDGFVVLPKYEFEHFLAAIQRFKIHQILVVPPILIQILAAPDICAKYDLSSIRYMFSGAAPLGGETIQELERQYPGWTIAQAYGMTETAVVVTAPSEHDVMQKAAGSILPGFRIKLVDTEGAEVLQYDTPGEVYVQGPSVTLGYLNNEKATAETFVEHSDGRWIRTGDEGIMTRAPSGNEQLVIVDRIKELIKVSGHQVAPAELEAHILAHPSVIDVAVIQIPDERSGEVPKAFVVRSPKDSRGNEVLAQEIINWVTEHKAHYKRIRGGVEFLNVIPKSPSGKILRRVLRDQEKNKRRSEGARL